MKFFIDSLVFTNSTKSNRNPPRTKFSLIKTWGVKHLLEKN